MSAHTSIIFIVPEFQCTPSLLTDTRPRLAIAYGCGTRIYPRTGHTLLAYVLTYLRCYRGISPTRGAYIRGETLQRLADVLVRTTASVDFTSPT